MWGAVLSNNAIHHHTGSKKIARAQAQPPGPQAPGPRPGPGPGPPAPARGCVTRPRAPGPPRAPGHVLASMLAATRPGPRAQGPNTLTIQHKGCINIHRTRTHGCLDHITCRVHQSFGR